MHVPLGGDILASAPSRPPGKACPLPSPPRPRQRPEVHDALCSGCRSPFTRFSRLSLAGTMFRHGTELEARQTSGWQTELSPYRFSMRPSHPNSTGFGKTPLLQGGGMERGRDREGKNTQMHLNSYSLQEEHPKGQHGSGELGSLLKLHVPQSAVLEGMPWCTHGHPPNLGAVCGAEEPTGRPSHPHKHAGGKQTCLPPTPAATASPSREGACACGWARSGHKMLERVGWGFLQAEVHWRDSAPCHASDVSSLYYRDRQVQEQSVEPFIPELPDLLLESPAPPTTAPASLPLARAGTHLHAGSLA